MLVDYAVTDLDFFDVYSDAAPHAKILRGNGIINFILHFFQCITFNNNKIVIATLISKELLKSLYSRLGFKVIKYFALYPNFEEARKVFHYD